MYNECAGIDPYSKIPVECLCEQRLIDLVVLSDVLLQRLSRRARTILEGGDSLSDHLHERWMGCNGLRSRRGCGLLDCASGLLRSVCFLWRHDSVLDNIERGASNGL